MRPTLSPFVSVGGTMYEVLARLLSLVCWSIGGCVYVYNSVEAIYWSSIFPPPGNNLFGAIWLMHTAVRFLTLWMPMALLLIHWRIKKQMILFLYLLGPVLAILLSVISVILASKYINVGESEGDTPNVLKREFFETTMEMINVQGIFPRSFRTSSSLARCCSWFGPIDFFEMYDKNPKLLSNPDFMKGVQECYGNIFTVEQEGNELKYSTPADNSTSSVIEGCSAHYAIVATRLINYIICMTIAVILLSCMFIALYSAFYWNLRSNSVAPAENRDIDEIKMEETPTNPDVAEQNSENWDHMLKETQQQA